MKVDISQTDFIRMMTPEAGGTDAITQNRGYVAIPEVGDQVMVGVEYDHPDKPFVMGGMFHGGTALRGGINNHLRSIQTKSGIKVLMNDDEKSVTILDPSGNTWFMDGNGNIEVTAPKNMTFTAGEDINISAGKNMNTQVGENQSNFVGDSITNQAGNDITVTAGNDIRESAAGNRTEMSDNRTEIADQVMLRQSEQWETFAGEVLSTSTEGETSFQSSKTIKWNSAEKSNLF